MIFFSVWCFAKIINPFVPFPCLSILWVESEATMRSFYSFSTNPLEPLWLSSNWKVIFTTAALLCGMIFRENLSSPSYYPGLASFPFTLWIHLCLSGDDIWFSLLWCGDDISLGKGKGWNVSTFPPTSFHPSPSLPFHFHLPVPPLPIFHSHPTHLVVEDSPVHTMEVPSRPSESNPVICNRLLVWTAHILSIRKVSC